MTPNDIDAPLLGDARDALGRRAYARRVADMIRRRRGDHSAVFAIYGEWGSGKTSFKNFVLAEIKAAAQPDPPIVIEFNPWEWEGPRQVAEAFFAQIADEIGVTGPKGAKASERLGRYASYFSVGATMANSAATLLPLLVPGTGPLATLFGKFLKDSGDELKKGAEFKADRPSLAQLRNDLIASIREIGRTIIVTIDDVDRLTTAETAILFQLLKANADFPNVVYLVLCDRDVVAKNLDPVVAGHGVEYLEKIVQVPLPLPKAYPEQLRASLLDGVREAISRHGVARHLDDVRLVNLYDLHARSFFRTMRDVKRFVANIDALLPVVARDDQTEVDLVDFIGIELLRTFDPSLYEAIYAHRGQVTGLERVSKSKEFLAILLGPRDPDGREAGIFGELFPRFTTGSLKKRHRAIAHHRYFDRYFVFGIPPDQLTAAEERDLLSRRGHAGFADQLQEARERGRLQYLLEVLDRTDQPRSENEMIAYLSSLAAFCDTLHMSDGAEDVRSYRGQIEGLTFATLKPLDLEVRTNVLIAACQKSDSLYFPTRFEEHFRLKEPQALLTDGIGRLRGLALSRLESAGARLRRHPAVGELLLWWLDNGDPAVPKAHAREMLEDRDSLLHFISTFSSRSLSVIDGSRKRLGDMTTVAKQIDRLVPIDEVLRRLEEIDDSLTSGERELARAVRLDAERVAKTDADNADM